MLQHELGHASIATTQKYGHLGRDERMMHTLKLFENDQLFQVPLMQLEEKLIETHEASLDSDHSLTALKAALAVLDRLAAI